LKTWTVVVELKDANNCTKQEIELLVASRLADQCEAFQIYECSEAHYGPKPGDVTLTENPGRMIGEGKRNPCTE
jgi:hypothetical protein